MELRDWKVDHRIITLYLELELRKEYDYVIVSTIPSYGSATVRYVIHYGATEEACLHADMLFYAKSVSAGSRYQITLGNEQMDEQYYTYMNKDDLTHRIENMLLFLEGREVK